jgi:hypothetical protein
MVRTDRESTPVNSERIKLFLLFTVHCSLFTAQCPRVPSLAAYSHPRLTVRVLYFRGKAGREKN